MITSEQYFGAKPHTNEHGDAAWGLLVKVNTMLSELVWDWPVDPDTGTCISGTRGGAGDGGFRLHSATTGAPKSMHKRAHAVDVFDPDNELDGYITDELLEKHGLYREHPDATPGWCHLQDEPPGSGNRTFRP